MSKLSNKELKTLSLEARKLILEGVYNAKSGHPGGSLSIIDTLVYIYNNEMNIDPKNPKDENRDRFVLSKGHCAPALYATLALKGYFAQSEIKNLRKVGHMLQGHPDMKGTPGVDMSTGSLGQGISVACGMALSAKMFNKDYKVFVAMGDGEIQEGMAWEAFMFASHQKLDNLVVVVDNNGLQIDGKVEDICSLEPITDKFSAFGWNVLTIDGHNFDEIATAFEKSRVTNGKPTVIIQKSIKGKCISFMENNVAWHGSAPNQEQYEQAIKELDAQIAELN